MTHSSFHKTAAKIAHSQCTLEYLLPCGCHEAPFQWLLLGCTLRLVGPGFIPRNSFWPKASNSCIVSTKDQWKPLCWLCVCVCVCVCVHLSASMASKDDRPWNSQALQKFPLHNLCWWMGWSIIHLLLCYGCHASLHQTNICCQVLLQYKGDHSAVQHQGLPLLIHLLQLVFPIIKQYSHPQMLCHTFQQTFMTNDSFSPSATKTSITAHCLKCTSISAFLECTIVLTSAKWQIKKVQGLHCCSGFIPTKKNVGDKKYDSFLPDCSSHYNFFLHSQDNT